MNRFRAFLSYSHRDQRRVEAIESALRGIGLIPIWDRNIAPGLSFTDVVKSQIATAHLFIPILTMNTVESPWVHQEIGFAIGIDIPMLPIALGSLPGQMLSGVQALHIREDLSDLDSKLREIDLETLVLPHRYEPELERLGVSVQVADSSEERTRMLVNYAQTVTGSCRIRQRVIFSSFSLPLADPRDPAWDAVDSPPRRSEAYRRSLRREREIMETHARKSGCSLLLHLFAPSPSDASAQRARIMLLIDFLESMPEHMVKVAITRAEMHDSLILVGNWFGARAAPPRAPSDYRQTFLCRHAPTLLRWVTDFDRTLDETLEKSAVSERFCRDAAVVELKERFESLRKM